MVGRRNFEKDVLSGNDISTSCHSRWVHTCIFSERKGSCRILNFQDEVSGHYDVKYVSIPARRLRFDNLEMNAV